MADGMSTNVAGVEATEEEVTAAISQLTTCSETVAPQTCGAAGDVEVLYVRPKLVVAPAARDPFHDSCETITCPGVEMLTPFQTEVSATCHGKSTFQSLIAAPEVFVTATSALAPESHGVVVMLTVTPFGADENVGVGAAASVG